MVNVPDAVSLMSGTLSVMMTVPGSLNAGMVSVITPAESDVVVMTCVLFAPELDVISSVAFNTTPACLT